MTLHWRRPAVFAPRPIWSLTPPMPRFVFVFVGICICKSRFEDILIGLEVYFSDIHNDTIVPDERVSHYFALLLFDEYKSFNFSWRKRLRKSLADISLQGLRAADLSIRLINEANLMELWKKSAILCHDNEDKDDDYFVSLSQKTPASTPPTFLFWMQAEKQWMVRTFDHCLIQTHVVSCPSS